MSLHTIIAKSEKLISDNSPLILTAIGAAGVVGTAFLTGKATIKAVALVEEQNKPSTPKLPLSKTDVAKLVWKLYLPAGGLAITSIAAIILANRIDTRRMAALAAAYSVSERARSEYKDKVVEKLGKKKAKEVEDELAQEKLKGVNTSHVVVGSNQILMLDTFSMRPFVSTMEKVRKVENDLREVLLNPGEKITCSDWLKAIGLKETPYSDDFGWNGQSGFKLDYTAGLTDDNLPCLVWHFAIDPVYRPVPTDRFQI